jgi:type IX secretion system PorP/SprF family membrane protein
MKHLLLLLLLFTGSYTLQAQVATRSDMYLQNGFALNPAAVGETDRARVSLHGLSHLTGLPGNPQSYFLLADVPLSNELGAGVRILSDNRGPFSTFGIDGAVAYRLPVSEKNWVQLGASVGIVNQRLDANSPNLNRWVERDDFTLGNSQLNSTNVRLGIGAVAKLGRVEAQLALPYLVDNGTQQSGYILAGAGYRAQLNDEVELVPYALVRILPSAEDLAEFLLQMRWQETLWVQAGYRNTGSAMVGAGLQYRQLGIGYNYVAAGNGLDQAATGSHELMLRFLFDADKITQQGK